MPKIIGRQFGAIGSTFYVFYYSPLSLNPILFSLLQTDCVLMSRKSLTFVHNYVIIYMLRKWHNVIKNSWWVMGTLVDSEIIEKCKQKSLISDNFEVNNVKQCCYELRASDTYYELSIDKNNKQVINDTILFKPKQQTVVITMESLDLPKNIIARILTKGKWFSVGISPVNTYADPGFKGRLGIVFVNLSNNYIRIDKGESICKIEFSELSKDVSIPYSGQHGYETKIWPIPYEYILDKDAISKEKRIGNEIEELYGMYGANIGHALTRFYKFEKTFIVLSFIGFAVIALLLLFGVLFFKNDNVIPSISTFAIAFIGSIVGGLVVLYITRGTK